MGVDAVHEVRIRRDEAEEGRFLMVIVKAEIAAPVRQGLEILQIFVFVAQAGQVVRPPVADDLGGAGRIGLFRQEGDEVVRFDRGIDDQGLTFLEIQALLQEDAGISR